MIGADLGSDWSGWFEGFDVESRTTTVLRGRVADQAALHGVLVRLRDLAVPIIDVRRLGDGPSDPGSEGGNVDENG